MLKYIDHDIVIDAKVYHAQEHGPAHPWSKHGHGSCDMPALLCTCSGSPSAHNQHKLLSVRDSPSRHALDALEDCLAHLAEPLRHRMVESGNTRLAPAGAVGHVALSAEVNALRHTPRFARMLWHCARAA